MYVVQPRISQRIAVSVVFVAAMFISFMDITIVNVALPAIGRDLAVRPTAVDAVSLSFLVSLTLFIPVSGWLGDKFGGKRVLITAIVVFTGASALCGLAQNLGELVAARTLQGLGGGMLGPVGMAMLFRAFLQAERVRVLSLLTVATSFAPAFGPVLGGLLVERLSWRWVFYVNVPVGIAAVVFGLVFLEGGVGQAPGRFDLPGFLLSSAGLGLLMYGLSEAPEAGWSSTRPLIAMTVGLVLLVAMVVVELRTSAPLVALRLFGNRLFRSSSGVVVLTASAFLGSLYVASLYFQEVRGLSPLQSGLSTAPEALGAVLGAQLAGRVIYPRLGPRRHITAGLVGLAASMVLLGLLPVDANLWWARALMFAAGLSVAQVYVPNQTAAFATIDAAATGRASALFNAVRQLGAAIGVAALTATIVFVSQGNDTAAVHPMPYRAAFFVAAGISLIAVLCAQSIRDTDAANTIPNGAASGRHARANRPRSDCVACPQPAAESSHHD